MKNQPLRTAIDDERLTEVSEPDIVPAKSSPPDPAVLALLAEMRAKVAHAESNGNFTTVWHEQVKRLESILNGGSQHGS